MRLFPRLLPGFIEQAGQIVSTLYFMEDNKEKQENDFREFLGNLD